VLNCAGLLEFRFHAAVLYCSCSSLVLCRHPLLRCHSILLVFLIVSAALLQGAYSHTEKYMRAQRMRHKIASREEKASSVLAPRPLAGSPCFREIGRMAWCAQVSLQSIRHRSRCEARKAASATSTVSLLAFWHPQPTTAPVESCRGWPAGSEQVGMCAPGSEPGRRGASRATPANRVHAATALRERSNS